MDKQTSKKSKYWLNSSIFYKTMSTTHSGEDTVLYFSLYKKSGSNRSHPRKFHYI